MSSCPIAGFVQSPRSGWQRLQVWFDQGVLPTWQICRVWPDHEKWPWEPGHAGQEGEEMAAMLTLEESAVVCPFCH